MSGKRTDNARIKQKYAAARFSLTANVAHYDVESNHSLFKSGEKGPSTNYDGERGFDWGIRNNLQIFPTTTAIWLRFNSVLNDPIWIPEDAWYELYNVEFTNLFLTSTAETTAQVETVKTIADSGGDLNNQYFYLYTIVAATGIETVHGYWFDVDSGGTEPTDSVVDTWHEVDISEDDTANTIAAAIEPVTEATSGLTSTVATDTVTITHDVSGARRNGADGTATTGFTFAVSTPGAGTATTTQIVVV